MKKVAIMQPYFFPYVGYFQLISCVDQFVVYDNIQYTKKGWVTRNRFLQNGKDALFSLPIKASSDFLDIRDKRISSDFSHDKFLNRMREAYRRAPLFEQVFPLLERIVRQDESNLFNYLFNSISEVCRYLAIDTEIVVSSQLPIDHSLPGKDRVLAICRLLGADVYVNPIGGQALYMKAEFAARGIGLQFLKSTNREYRQFNEAFVPWLSIIDVMMFNPLPEMRSRLASDYELL
jgi:hypothetical protein